MRNIHMSQLYLIQSQIYNIKNFGAFINLSRKYKMGNIHTFVGRKHGDRWMYHDIKRGKVRVIISAKNILESDNRLARKLGEKST